MIEGIENAYPNYGLPKQKKYPLPDRKHVLSAIRFFNYVSPRDEKQLAEAILEKIKEYGMKDIGVGPDNRFLKYYKKEADHLEHHGILGQKWGVRRYQNEDGTWTAAGKERYGHDDDIVLKKGMELKRVTNNANETNKGHTYVSYKDLDALKYVAMAGEGGIAETSAGDGKGKTYQATLKLTKDLVIPAYENRVKGFIDSVNDMTIDQALKIVYPSQGLSRHSMKEQKKNIKNFMKAIEGKTSKELLDKAYKDYSGALVRSKELRDKFFSTLQKQGYNAVIDDFDVGYADSPLIIFERGETTKQVNVKQLTRHDSDLAQYELTKRGMNGR